MSKITLFLALFSFTQLASAALPVQHWQLPNGAQVYFIEDHDLPMIDVSIDFPAGSAYDPTGQDGLASLTQRLLDQGAGKLSDVQIADTLADTGAQLGGHFDADRAGLTLRSLSEPEQEQTSLNIFASLLAQPSFDPAVTDREKARVVDALKTADGEPQTLAAVAFQRAIFGQHPYAHRESGEIATVSKLTADDLRAFWRSHYNASHAIIALVGDMTRTQADQIANNLTIGLPDSRFAANTAIPPVPALTAASEKTIVFPSKQSQIFIGQPGVARGDPDYFALYTGNYVLGGGGFDSRLMNDVRQKHGLAYSVYSYFLPMREAGPFEIGLQTRTAATQQALAVVHQTVSDFMAKGVTAAELTQAKNSIIGGFPLRIDSNQKLLEYLAVIGFYHLPTDYLDTFSQRVAHVTQAQIHQAFLAHIQPSRMVTVIVGQPSAFQP